jgi:hypothetical protein
MEYKSKKGNIWIRIVFILAAVGAGAFGLISGLKAYPQLINTKIHFSELKDMSLDNSLVINFSFPIRPDKFRSEISISPSADTYFRWENNNQKLTIIPKKNWQPETTYRLYIPETRNVLMAKVQPAELSFSTEKYPRVSSFTPENGAKDVIIDTEGPMVADFNKSTQDFFIKFDMEPQSEVVYENNPGKTQFKILPKDKIEDGKKYSIKVSAKAKDAPDSDLKEIYSTSFETMPPPPVTWEKDYALRLDQARKYTKPQILLGKYIDINIAQQILSTFQDGKILDSYLISSGKRGMETPKGPTKIYNKAPRAYSKAYGLFMPNWMALASDGKFGIHELPEWPNGYKEGQAHLGIPVSHGCVRLGVGPAKIVYNWADIGTPVVVY